MKKKALSLALALVMCLGLTIPAFAESVIMESPFLSSAKITLSDMESREVVGGVTRSYAVITAKTGATLTIENNTGCTIREAHVNGKIYDFINDGKTFDIGAADGTPFVLTDAHIGLWFIADGSTNNGFFLNIIAGDSPTTPTQPQQPAGNATASPTNDSLTADGVLQTPTVYKINDSNYFKIRDLAAILNGTGKQFSVGYDAALNSVTATTGQGYAKQSGDLAGAATGGGKTAQPSNDTIYVNGQKVEAEVYKIDGSNYFKLRDLGKALNFYVGWTAQRGMYIETDKPYSE